MSVDPQTQHFCTTSCDCALSASDTSRVLRSPFVKNDFHKQGMGSRPLRDEETTASLADACAFKHTDNVARVTTRVRVPTEKNTENICLHCPATLPVQSGQKKNKTAAPAQHPTEGRVSSPHKQAPQNGCETTHRRERIRQFMILFCFSDLSS